MYNLDKKTAASPVFNDENGVIELRSDTFTKPSAGMLNAMMSAKVGDDVFGEDPTVNELETRMAALFDMEAGLFCPSGTMTNQLAIKCHTQPGDDVICDELSHVYQYEGGGIAVNSGCSVQLLKGNRGRVTATQVATAIHPDDVHKPVSRLVSLENTANRGGGACYNFEDILEIKKVCRENELVLHLDGARIFNAIVAKNQTPEQFGRTFDSISVCLSKGLGTPVGSVLLGNLAFIKKARRFRKVFGGGMRQAGFLAAAGLFALENNIERLSEDHANAREVSDVLASKNWIQTILPVETNILIFSVQAPFTASSLVAKLATEGIRAIAISPEYVRFVFHLNVTSGMVKRLISVIEGLE
ncbi:MAG: GntG family PLP-dependent aldolase [Bacteroidota bacterium]